MCQREVPTGRILTGQLAAAQWSVIEGGSHRGRPRILGISLEAAAMRVSSRSASIAWWLRRMHEAPPTLAATTTLHTSCVRACLFRSGAAEGRGKEKHVVPRRDKWKTFRQNGVARKQAARYLECGNRNRGTKQGSDIGYRVIAIFWADSICVAELALLL